MQSVEKEGILLLLNRVESARPGESANTIRLKTTTPQINPWKEAKQKIMEGQIKKNKNIYVK